MALTVLLALTGALILSFTFVPLCRSTVLSGGISHEENLITTKAPKNSTAPAATCPQVQSASRGHGCGRRSGEHGCRDAYGREFIPTLDEGDVAIHTMRVPETSLSQALELQAILEKTLKEKFPQIETIVGRVGTSEIATEPHPPSVGDNTLVMKPRDQWPDPKLPKADLVTEIEEEAGKLLGSNFEFSQPIRMRFNHLLSGVLSDVAVKVFGDDMDVLRRNAEDAAELVRKIPGASHVKVEQVSGLPILTVQLKRSEMARYGLNVSEEQDIVEVAVGGKSAGQVFEGDRRFSIVVRLPEKLRSDIEALKRLPIPLPRPTTGVELVSVNPGEERKQRAFVTLGSVAHLTVVTGPNQISREDGKRRVVVTCNVRDRDLGSFVAEAQKTIEGRLKLPAGCWITWGGEFEQLLSAAKRLEIVVPLALFLILALLFTAFGSLRYALLVFTGVPLALTGGIIALWLRDIPLPYRQQLVLLRFQVAVLTGRHDNLYQQVARRGKPVDDAVMQGALTSCDRCS